MSRPLNAIPISKRVRPEPPPTDRDVLEALAHKMGSPLGAVVNFLHLARTGAGSDETTEGIVQATANARAVLEGARRWLDATSARLAPETLEPTPLLTRTAGIVGCADRLILGPLPKLRACPDAFAWQWREILANAVHQAPGGRVHIRATSEDGAVALVAADTGPGWTAEEARRAFLPFATLPGRKGAAGMGLPIVRVLAARQGGSAWARSAIGGGAEVVVTYQTG